MRRPILNHTERGDAVYDPFVGSGSTIIAAETTGRIAYAIDIDPIYIDTAITRWQRFTGRTALLSATGDTFLEVAQSRKEGQHNA
jgi:DNA modification methylase